MSDDQPVTTSMIAARNREVVDLQNRDLMIEALRAAREVECLATAHLPPDDLERAKSICNLGAILSAGGNPAAAETMQRGLEALRMAVGDEHPMYARMVGISGVNRERSGDYAAAEEHYVRAIALLSRSPDDRMYLEDNVSNLTQLHTRLALRERELEAQHLTAATAAGKAHFERSLQGRAMRTELPQFAAEVQEFATRNLDSSSAFFAGLTTHHLAQAIVDARSARGEPFALFLRGFEGESYDYVIDNPRYLPGGEPGTKTVSTVTTKPSPVEPILIGLLGNSLAALTVANPASIDSSQFVQGARLPRLILPSQGWLEKVRALVTHAHLIVVDCFGLNSGLKLELETIGQCRKCSSTVIVLHRDRSELEAMEQTARAMADVAGGTLAAESRREWITREHPLLAPFERICYLEDLDVTRPDSVALFTDLIAVAPLIRTATRLGKTGTAFDLDERLPDAVLYLQVALFLAGEIPWSERGVIWFNLGILLRSGQRSEDAETCFANSHAVFATLDDAVGQGQCLAMLGDVRLAQGKVVEARQALRDALLVLDGASDTQYVLRSLQTLVEVARTSGDEDQAAAVEAELVRQKTEGVWSVERTSPDFKRLFLASHS